VTRRRRGICDFRTPSRRSGGEIAVVVGHEQVIETILVAFFAGGVLIEGVPESLRLILRQGSRSL
jgi:hypothetical protein